MTELERLAGEPPSPFEGLYGFSRMVLAGPLVIVGGTTSVDEYGVVHGETPYEQASLALAKIVGELSRAGLGAEAVIQGRVYVTDITRADDVGRAWSEVLGTVRPLMTMVEVARLIDPRMLVEIEAVAYRAWSSVAGSL